MASTTIRFRDVPLDSPIDIGIRAIKLSDGSFALGLDRAFCGAGDSQSMYNATTAQLLGVVKGTAAAPDSSVNPLIKAERLIQVNEAAIGGDGSEQLSAIVGICVGTAGCETQPVGVLGLAKTSSTVSFPGNDATGIFGIGRVIDSGTGFGIGGAVEGRRDTNTGKCYALEARTTNQTATDGVYNANGASDSMGIWITAGGPTGRLNAAAIQIGAVNTCQWDIGIGFNKISSVSAVKTASYRDDGDAATSILINGAHATAAIAIASGSGALCIGETTPTAAGILLEVISGTGADPFVQFGSVAANQGYGVRLRNSSGVSNWFVASSANEFLTGTAAGDGGIRAATSGKKLHLGGTASVIAVTQSNQLGFFQHATAAQQTVTGSRATDAWRTSLMAALVAYGIVLDTSTA